MPTETSMNGGITKSSMQASKRNAWLLPLVLIALTSIVSAQLYTGSITGTVTDPSGAVLPNAKISVVDAEKGYTFSATSSADGRYVVRQLSPGKYSVSVDVAGFQGQKKENIAVSVNDNIGVDFALKVGPTSEVVDVQAEGVQLQTQDAVTGQVIDRKLINDLPLVSRSVLDLAYLTPGITEVDTDCQGCMANNFTSNGSRNATADILLDGVSSTNFEQNSGILAPTYVPSVDAVEEFKVQQSNFSAEFGFTGATVINVVTRSGTNKLHGSLYEFLRNEKLDANDWFNDLHGDPKSPLRLNDFGGTVGGPIIKNKTFFFFDYEGNRVRSFASANAGVPSDAERGGDFSELCTSNGGTFDGSGQCDDHSQQLYDPYISTKSGNTITRTAFIPFNNLANYASPGNPNLNGSPYQVANPGAAGNLIDPVAAKLINLFPEPTSDDDPTNNWFASGTNKSSLNQFDIKIDHRFSETKQLSAKYAERRSNSHSFNCFPNEADPCTGGPVKDNAYLFSINYLQTFSPNLVMNLSYGFTRGSTNEAGITGDYPDLNPVSDLGLPSYMLTSGYKQFPQISINNYTPAGPGGNIGTQFFSIIKEGQETHTMLGSLDWIHGKHDVKFGGEMRVHRINFAQPGWPGGAFAFDEKALSETIVNDNPSGGNSMASFLTGIGFRSEGDNTYEVPNNVATQNFQFGGFVQDNLHASSKLTVNLGIRYEISRPRTERFNRMNWLDPTLSYNLTAPGFPDLPVQGAEVFANSKQRYNYDTYYGAWQPRFGFAYELPHGAVVRGGYGIYFSQPRSGAAGTGPWGYQAFDQQTPWQTAFQGNGIVDSGVLPGARLSDPYPALGSSPAGPKLPAGTACGQPNCTASLGPFNDVGFGATGPIPSASKKIPYEQAWSLGVQKSLPWKIVAEVNYVGKKGTHLYLGGFRDLNHLGPDFEKARKAGTVDIDNLANGLDPNPFAPYITDPQSGLSADQISPLQDPNSEFHVPFPQFTSFAGDSPPIANSIYHAAQFRFEKAFSSGLEFLVTYAVSKSIDSASATDDSISWLGGGFQGGTIGVQNPNDLSAERALSTFDIPQVLQFSYTYALPIGRGRKVGKSLNPIVNGIIGGWQLNGIWRFQSGRPLIFVEDGSLSTPIPTYGQRPTLNEAVKINHGSHVSMTDGYFLNGDTALEISPDLTLGNAPRTYGAARQPGAKLVNMALFKEFPMSSIREGMRMEFRLEAFNALNHPNFGPADTVVGGSSFGTITSLAQGMREVQLGLKFYF
jgi:hypothetical protein